MPNPAELSPLETYHLIIPYHISIDINMTTRLGIAFDELSPTAQLEVINYLDKLIEGFKPTGDCSADFNQVLANNPRTFRPSQRR